MHLYVVKDLFMFICSCFPPTGDRLFLLLTWNLLAWWWEKAMAPHSSPLAWKIPWMAEPDRLRSMGWLRVGHDWATSLSLFTFMHWRRKWQATPVFLPRESQRWGSLVGCRPMGLQRVGHDWSDLAAAAWWWGSGRFLVSCLGLTLRQGHVSLSLGGEASFVILLLFPSEPNCLVLCQVSWREFSCLSPSYRSSLKAWIQDSFLPLPQMKSILFFTLPLVTVGLCMCSGGARFCSPNPSKLRFCPAGKGSGAGRCASSAAAALWPRPAPLQQASSGLLPHPESVLCIWQRSEEESQCELPLFL